MRTTFIRTLTDLARDDSRIVVMTGDLGFKIFDTLRETIGPRFINAGVAESNMISMAAGLAMTGKRVYCYSMVPFVAMRSFEQVRVDICSHNLPVTLVGIGAALGYPMEGTTHHALEDIALMRALPNMSVICPADKLETEAVIRKMINHTGPLFLRLAKDSADTVHQSAPPFEYGKAICCKSGSDVVFVSTGILLGRALELASRIEQQGYSVGVWSVPCIKPLDLDLINQLASSAKVVFTLEEHSIMGGFGSAVAEELIETDFRGRFCRLGLPDAYFDVVGDTDYLHAAAGIDTEALEQKIWQVLRPASEQLLRKASNS